jgi:hypothetical protein
MAGCRVKKITGQSAHCSSALYTSDIFVSRVGSVNIASSWMRLAIGGGVSRRA